MSTFFTIKETDNNDECCLDQELLDKVKGPRSFSKVEVQASFHEQQPTHNTQRNLIKPFLVVKNTLKASRNSEKVRHYTENVQK